MPYRRRKAKIVSRTTLHVDGFEVQVVRKTIRNMYLRVKSPTGTVEVSAPARMRDEEIASFVRGRRAWIERQKERVDGAVFEWTDDNKRLAAANINAQLPVLLAHWEPIVGRKPTHITLRLMNTRWGSCTPNTGRIRLNLQLGLMDQRFLEYVLVHEMAHLWASGHGAEFQRRMDAYLPDWRERRRALNNELVW